MHTTKTNALSNVRGSAMVAVVIIVVLVSVVVALAVKQAMQKQEDTDTAQTLSMLREANRTAKQQLSDIIMGQLVDGNTVDSAYLTERLNALSKTLKVQYPRINSVSLAASSTGFDGIGLSMATASQVEDDGNLTDPFRYCLGGTASPTQIPKYTVEIGYRSENDSNAEPATRAASEFLSGFQTGYQSEFSGRLIGAENMAWAHYAPQYLKNSQGQQVANRSALISLDTWTPLYIKPSSVVGSRLNTLQERDKRGVSGDRSGMVFMNTPVVGNASTEGQQLLNVTGAKTVFARAGVAGNLSLALQRMGPRGDNEAAIPAIDRWPSLSAAMIRSQRLLTRGSWLLDDRVREAISRSVSTEVGSGGEVDRDATAFLGTFLYSERQLEGSKFTVLSERGVQEIVGYSADGKDFWGTQSNDTSRQLFTPASRASIRVVLEAVAGAQGLTPTISSVYALNYPTAGYSGENWKIIESVSGTTHWPSSPSFWVKYKQHLACDATPGSTEPDSILIIDGANTVAGSTSPDIRALRNLLREWVTPHLGGNDLGEAHRVVRLSVNNDLQIFLKGAVGYYNTLNSALLYPQGLLAVDISRLTSDVPSYTAAGDAKDAGRAYRGIFVDVKNPMEATASNEQKIVYRNMLNAAMILIGRDYATSENPNLGVTRTYRDNNVGPAVLAGRAKLSTYTTKFPDNEAGTTYILGTNGRITFDTSVNLNLGTSLGVNGSLIPASDTTSANEMRSDLTAFYGNTAQGGVDTSYRVTEPRTNGGIHRSVFASRLRPAIATFIGGATSGAAVALGQNPSVSNDTLISSIVVPGSMRVLARFPMPDAYPVNAYANTALLSGFYTTQTKVPVYDGYQLGGVKPSNWDSTELNIKQQLTSVTQSYVRTAVTQLGNPLYSQALAARLSNPDPAVSASLLDPSNPNSLITIIGRKEDQSFYRVVFKRFGLQADYDDSYATTGQYNFRIQFSGNIKQEIWRDCRVNGETVPQLFRSLSQAKVDTGSGSQTNYIFRNCPSATIVSVNATSLHNQGRDPNNRNKTIGGTPLPASQRTYSFFYPAASSSAAGPASVAAAVTQYLQVGEDRTLEEIMRSGARATGEYMTPLNNTGNTTLNTHLAARAAALLQNRQYTLQLSTNNWVDVLSLSPFFGQIEYILADSLDDESWVSQLTRNHKIYGSWTVDPGLKLVQVRILRYDSPTVTSGLKHDDDVGIANFTDSERNVLLSELDGQALAVLRTTMSENLNTPEKIANLTRVCLPVATHVLPKEEMDGQISGQIRFFPPTDISAGGLITDTANPWGGAGWSLYTNHSLGHIVGGNGLDFTASMPTNITVSPQQTAWNPYYNVTAVGSRRTAVRGHLTVNRDRFITAATYDISTTGTVVLDTSSDDFDVTPLTTELRDALVIRNITFKLFSAATFQDGSQPVLTGFDFVGAGTLITAVDSPHPAMANIGLISGASVEESDVFAWHGSIRTGVGIQYEPAVAAQLEAQADSLFKPTTVIYGDPLLSSKEWGRLSVLKETPVTGAKEFNHIVRRR